MDIKIPDWFLLSDPRVRMAYRKGNAEELARTVQSVRSELTDMAIAIARAEQLFPVGSEGISSAA